MLDNTAKQLSDQLSNQIAPASSSITNILATDLHHIDNRHLTIAKYLPITTFKSASTLKTALDNIYCEINMQKRMGSAPHLRKTAINCMLVNLAKNISITTSDLSTDYGSKLALIDTALNHRIFSRGLIKRGFYAIVKLFAYLLASSQEHQYLSDAQKVLVETKSDIQKSRDNIILC